jgi:malonate transporter
VLVVATTIAPIFLIIVAGFGLRRTKLFPVEAWPPVERITYYVLFPSLLFISLATADMNDLPISEMAIAVIGTPTIMTLLLLLLRPKLSLSGPAFTSLMQGSIRFNTYIGVPLVIAFYGIDTIALGALFIGFMVPFINLVCVWILARYGDGEVNTRGTLGAMARNPLILSCLAGIAVNVAGLGLAVPLETLFDLLGRAAPPVGLLCVGAGLDVVAARAGRAWVALSAAIKLMAMPLIALLLALALGLDDLSTRVLVIFHALPTAPSAYILARQMGGDARLMAGMLTAHTALGMVTLPIWIALLGT